MMFIYTDFVDDLAVKTLFSQIFVIVFEINIAINLLIVAISGVKSLYFKIKLLIKRLKRKMCRKKI